jgi:hypothetical protein
MSNTSNVCRHTRTVPNACRDIGATQGMATISRVPATQEE